MSVSTGEVRNKLKASKGCKPRLQWCAFDRSHYFTSHTTDCQIHSDKLQALTSIRTWLSCDQHSTTESNHPDYSGWHTSIHSHMDLMNEDELSCFHLLPKTQASRDKFLQDRPIHSWKNRLSYHMPKAHNFLTIHLYFFNCQFSSFPMKHIYLTIHFQKKKKMVGRKVGKISLHPPSKSNFTNWLW